MTAKELAEIRFRCLEMTKEFGYSTWTANAQKLLDFVLKPTSKQRTVGQQKKRKAAPALRSGYTKRS